VGIHTTNGATGLKLVHDTIGNQGAGKGPDSGGYDYAITGFRTLNVSYCDISGFKDGVDISDGTFDNNYVHDLSEFSGAHTQAMYVYPATTSLTINHNTLINQTPIQYSTAAVYIAPDSPGQNHDTITDNWMAGGSYTFYGGDSSAKYIVVKDNVCLPKYPRAAATTASMLANTGTPIMSAISGAVMSGVMARMPVKR
jgi:hypothetical protein